jgi:hypothetical protein
LNETVKTPHGLEDLKINVKIKLSALWASVMFCYIYADYFGLYRPGKLQAPSWRVFFTPNDSRSLVGRLTHVGDPEPNDLSVSGAATGCQSMGKHRHRNRLYGNHPETMWGWAFYIFYGVIEIALTSLVVWYAWRWPKAPAST